MTPQYIDQFLWNPVDLLLYRRLFVFISLANSRYASLNLK